MSAPRLFDAVVKASGLAPVIANNAIKRAIVRAGAVPETMTRPDLARALPHIRQALGVFLQADQIAARMDAIAKLASTDDSQKSAS